jgi:hypothetical protein
MIDTPTTPPPQRGFATVIIVWMILLVFGGFSYFVEGVWVAFLVWLPVYVAVRSKSWLAGGCLLCLCLGILYAHAHGDKLFGGEYINEEMPATGPEVIVAFGPDARITLSDGRSFDLAGLRVPEGRTVQSLELKDHKASRSVPYQGPSWATLLETLQQRRPWLYPSRDFYSLYLSGSGLPVRLHLIDNTHASVEVIFRYRPPESCLGYREERMFPRQVEGYRLMDLGAFLLGSNAFEADDSVIGQAYRSQFDARRTPRAK